MNTTNHSPLVQAALAVFLGTGLFILALGSLLLGFQSAYADRIYPGVRVGWVDLSGLRMEEATKLLAQEYDYPQRGRILLWAGDQTWGASPSELGLLLGPAYNAQAAYQVGRQGAILTRLGQQFEAWYRGVSLPVHMVFDERIAEQYLRSIASQTDRPTVEASLRIDGTEVVVLPGQVGRTLDVTTTLENIRSQVETMRDGDVPLVIRESPPVILDASEQARIAEAILSQPLKLKIPQAQEGDPGPWTFRRPELARMLVIERKTTPEGETYQVGISAELLRSFLEEIAPSLAIKKVNARFVFNDDTNQLELLQPSVTGRSLNIEASLKAIQSAVLEGKHKVALVMNQDLPAVTSEATAESLGVTELVSSHTTYFYGSSTARKHNIATAAGRFHGLLVAPGETFSMAEALGDVSLDTGYAEAWIIYGNRTIKGVGGGVCQVSTTLFRTVFFGGYPVVERHPHAYRVYYYEQTYGGGYDSKWAGLDATVYVPLVDFKFKNDTPYWLLMETYVGDNYLTWKFYSTSDGRTMDWETTGLQNIQDPPDPLYVENEELAKGEIKQVDWAIEGADVTVRRYVFRDGELLFRDIFTTHYMPWRAVCEYGPGTKGMPPENPKKNNPCKPDKN